MPQPPTHPPPPPPLWTLSQLLALGVGGTVGSGLFVLVGQLTSQLGQDAVYAFGLSGLAATLSGLCFSEWSTAVPRDGSTFAYMQHIVENSSRTTIHRRFLVSLLPTLAAACLTLEYGVAGAAVARTWGDKYRNLMQHDEDNVNTNMPAALLSLLCTLVLAAGGTRESQRVTTILTILKMLLVVYMISMAYTAYQPIVPTTKNTSPSAILRGSVSTFFGYLGYDEICSVAGHVEDPGRTLPRALLGTLCIVMLTYILAAHALVHASSSSNVAADGFPQAFADIGYTYAARISAWGELMTLPVVVFISLLAQPRLLLQMGKWGDATWWELVTTFGSGCCMTILAYLVPFAVLDDGISAGILLAFTLTDSSLLAWRCQGSWKVVLVYNGLCILTAWSCTVEEMPRMVRIVLGILTLTCMLYFTRYPLVPLGTFAIATPWIPCAGIALNWYLVVQLEWQGLVMLAAYLAVWVVGHVVIVVYGGTATEYERVGEEEEHDEKGIDMTELKEETTEVS